MTALAPARPKGLGITPRQIRLRAPALAVLATALALASVAGLTSGAIPISLVEVLFSEDAPLHRSVLLEIRAPRVLLAGCVGAALAVSGASLRAVPQPACGPGADRRVEWCRARR